MKQHQWVRHTIVPVKVDRIVQTGEFVFTRADAPGIVVGCDDCGLPLTQSTFEEPCLSELEDQMEEGEAGA